MRTGLDDPFCQHFTVTRSQRAFDARASEVNSHVDVGHDWLPRANVGRDLRMSNIESQMTKECRNPNDEEGRLATYWFDIRHLTFDIHH